MGMSASQARFLSLTARKTNVEYEGQQINQQRTTLSNESSNYYSQLTSLDVPIPPSTDDYTKITYTFKDGSESNTVTSIVATKTTKDDGIYMLNYVQVTPTNNMIVNGTNVISNPNQAGTYYIGKVELQQAENLVYKDPTTGAITVKDVVVIDNENNPGATIPSSTNTTQYYSKTGLKNRFLAAGIPADVVNNYSIEELKNKIIVENQYRMLAEEKYMQANWHVRYVKNSSTGNYEPAFYSDHDLSTVDYNEKTSLSLNGVKAYMFGETTETREIKNARAKVEKDASGRYQALFILSEDADGDNMSGTRYELTTTTETDDNAYNDAMNQYYYDKAVYDQTIEEINAKLEIIQVQDKNLELKLKQLDTEENAIQTEMDAVKKVISKNVESSFKTFNA